MQKIYQFYKKNTIFCSFVYVFNSISSAPNTLWHATICFAIEMLSKFKNILKILIFVYR